MTTEYKPEHYSSIFDDDEQDEIEPPFYVIFFLFIIFGIPDWFRNMRKNG